MDVLLTVGFLCTILFALGSGQSCPPVQNVAKVCSSSSYTGARVLMDTSDYTDGAKNCSCTFSTTANTLRIVTYAAPNYQQCNSAIRLYSSSGNAMQFQCLMSGTYLDTSVHKEGGAEFQAYGPVFDNNYCLVLEHLGTMTDSITISCNRNEDINNSINLEVTTSGDQTVTTTTYFDATPTSGISRDSGVSTTTTNSLLTLSNSNMDLNTSNNNTTFNTKEKKTGQISLATEFTTSSGLKTSHFPDTTIKNSVEKASISISVGNTRDNSSQRRDIGTLILKNRPRDIITFDKVTTESGVSETESSKMIVESNDTATNDMVTATSDLGRFGSDINAYENQTPLPNFGISFGNDAIRKDTVTLNPAVVTTVDQITLRTLENSQTETPVNDSQDLLLQNSSGHSNAGVKSTTNEQIFGDDAVTRIYTNLQSTSIDTGAFGSDVAARENKTTDRNLDKTFENDWTRKDVGLSDSVAFTTEKIITFGNDALLKEVSTKNTLQEGSHDRFSQNSLGVEETHGDATSGRHNFGSDAFIGLNSPTSTSYPKTFGSDITFGGNQNFDISFENVTLRRGTVTSSTPDIPSEKRAMFENDALLKEIITDKPYTETKHSNATSSNPTVSTDAVTHAGTYTQMTSFESQTITPDLVVGENKMFVQNTGVTFGNDAARNKYVTTPSKDQATLRNDLIVKDVSGIENSTYDSMFLNRNNNSHKGTLGRSKGESLIMTSDIRPTIRVDTVDGENQTFGPDIVLTERATFGNEAIRPVPTVAESTTPLRQTFGADAVTKESSLSTNANRGSVNLLLHDITNERTISSPSFITTNERQTFGFDAIPKDRVDRFQNEKHTFGPDIASKEQTTFGSDVTPPVPKISEPTTQTRQRFDDGAEIKQSSLSFDLNRGNANQLLGDITSKRTTPYPYISTTTARQSFGFDAVPKERVDGFQGEKHTFGPDIASKERLTFGNDAIPPVPTVAETTTQIRQSFGADAVTKQSPLLSNSKNERANFLPGELTNEKSTSNLLADTTSKRQSFGFDALPKDRIDRFQGGQDTFGPDIASKERTTFGNDAIRPVSTVSEATAPIGQSFGADAVTKQNSLSLNANREKVNILLGDFTKDRISTDPYVDTTNIRQTFGFDAIPKETTTYGSVFLNTDRTNILNTVRVGKEMITTQQPRRSEAVASFGSATLMDILKKEALSVANETNVTTKTNLTTETLPTKVLFGTDAILKEEELPVTSTSTPNKSLFDSDRVKQSPLETMAPLSTFNDTINSLQSEVLTPEKRVTFDNDVIRKETLTKTQTISTSTEPSFVTTEFPAIFGPDIHRSNGALMEDQRNISSFSNDTRHSILSLDDTQDLRNDTSAELLVHDGPSILNSTPAAVNSTSNPRSTFGLDAIGKELFTDSTLLDNENKIDLGKTVVLRETVDSVEAIENTSAMAKEGLIELPRISLGNDLLKKEDLLTKSTISPHIMHINQASLSNTLPPSRGHEVLGSTAQALDLDIATRIVPLDNDVVAGRPFAPLSHLNTEVSAAFGHDAISGVQSTVSTPIQNDDHSTREIFGDFKLRRQFLTTESVNVATATLDSMRSLANDMKNNNIETVVINHETIQNTPLPEENTAFETNVSRTNSLISSSDNSMVSVAFTATTMQSGVIEPIIDETIVKQRDASLLSSINEIRPNELDTLVGSILKTHNETISNINGNILRSLSGNNEDISASTEISTMRSGVIPNDVQSSTDFSPTPGEVLIPGDLVSTPKEGLPVTTAMDVSKMVSEATVSDEKDVTNIEVPIIQISTVTEKDVSTATTTTTPNFLETTTSITTDATTPSERPVMKTTKRKSTSTQSTLPAIIPGQQDTFKPTVPIIKRMSTPDARTSTESAYRTTKKMYDVMVGEPGVTDERNVVDGSSNIRSSKDQLNVSLDDETDRPFFNMNNKTYIITVIAVAGFIVLVAVISVIICNKRKSRSAKADITNGVTAISHNNAVFDNDVSEAERGNVPAASNGVDTAKPVVEVIEPQVNGSDNKMSGNL